MSRNLAPKRSYKSIYANDNDAMVPEFWANETLMILEENMPIAGLVYRNFEPTLQNYGDVVNTRKPAEMSAYRKTDTDDVTLNNATLANIQIPMNQWIHASFMIMDGERSKSMKDLVETHLKPAALAIRRSVDRVILGSYAQFLAYGQMAGKLGGLSGTTAKDYILDTRKKMNQLKNSPDGRQMIWGTSSETEVLKAAIFLEADKVGDFGSALREASLGRKLGMQHYMSQNMGEVYSGNTKTTGAINNAAGYPIGTTSITVDGFAAAIGVGSWVWVDGQPHRVVSTTGGATPTAIVLATGLVTAVADNAVVYSYTPGQVNNSGGYAAGYAKEITVDVFTVAPQIGQAVSFGITAPSSTPTAATAVYTIIGVTSTTGITLDRPLEAAIADDAKVNIAPEGYYNMAFLKEAIAFVCRPLAPAPAGTGALSAVANSNNLSMRSTITYNGTKQGLLITLDMLLGIKVIEPLKGTILLG